VINRGGLGCRPIGPKFTTKEMLGIRKLNEHWIGNVLGMGLVQKDRMMSRGMNLLTRMDEIQNRLIQNAEFMVPEEITKLELQVSTVMDKIASQRLELIEKSLQCLDMGRESERWVQDHVSNWNKSVHNLTE
jgi:hypothetical protein